MAIRPVPPEVPDRFNPASLFLDDIEEIIRIFVEAEENREEKPYFKPDESLETTFRVDSQTCDELDDLKKIHPHFTYNFQVQVQRTGFTASFWTTDGSTKWYSYGLDENDKWGTYHRLERVLERRKLRWRSLLHGHPKASYWIYGAATALLIFLLPVPFIDRVPRTHISCAPSDLCLGDASWTSKTERCNFPKPR
jgi:hypothetical protein